jgi:hypothetical protein
MVAALGADRYFLHHRRADAQGRWATVFIAEHILPGPDMPHLFKLFDIHMMCWGTDRERTEAQYGRLLEEAGWKPAGSH